MYVMYVATYMTLKQVIRTMALLLAQHGQMFRKIGFALSAE